MVLRFSKIFVGSFSVPNRLLLPPPYLLVFYTFYQLIRLSSLNAKFAHFGRS